MDGTVSKHGHNYMFMDLQWKRLLFATEGRDSTVLGSFVSDFSAHNGDPQKNTGIGCDLSPAFIAGIRHHIPQAEVVFDRFHVMQLVGKAADEVRQEEMKTNHVLKKTRYIWLKNPASLTARQGIRSQPYLKCILKRVRG